MTATSHLLCNDCAASFESSIPEEPVPPVPNAFQLPSQHFTASEGLDIRTAVDSASRNIEKLDANIAELKAMLQKSEEARRLQADFLQRHKPLLSSSQRLPVEIWTEIFRIASAKVSNIRSRVFLSASPRNAPLSISHVCSEWRRIALRMPGIWSSIHVHIKDTCPEPKIKLLSLYLNRGQRQSLDVFWDMDTKYSWDEQEEQVKQNVCLALRLLFVHSRRWRSLKIRVPPQICNNGLFPVTDASNLEILDVATLDSSTDWDHPVLLTHAPNLSRLCTTDFRISSGGSPSSLPWSGLSAITLGKVGRTPRYILRDVSVVLKSCPELKELVVYIGGGPAEVLEPIQHPNLAKLKIHSNGSHLQRLLTSPALSELYIKQHNIDEKAYAEFISRTRSLRKLSIEGDASQVACLNTLPDSSIEHLELILTCASQDYASSLRDFIQFSPLKHLKSLRIRVNFLSGNGVDNDAARRLSLVDALMSSTTLRKAIGIR